MPKYETIMPKYQAIMPKYETIMPYNYASYLNPTLQSLNPAPHAITLNHTPFNRAPRHEFFRQSLASIRRRDGDRGNVSMPVVTLALHLSHDVPPSFKD